MKWLLIVVLAVIVSISGCSNNKTGYVCPTCEAEVASTAPACPHCGQVFSLRVAPISISKNNTDFNLIATRKIRIRTKTTRV